MTLPDTWCNNVSRSIGISPEDVRKNVTLWFNRGRSLDYIKRVLILTALSRGKKLIFVSKHGTN